MWLELLDLQLAPAHFEWPLAPPDAVDLQTDEALGVRLQFFLIDEIGHLRAPVNNSLAGDSSWMNLVSGADRKTPTGWKGSA